jgi:SAM-dependent methyltransferase
VAGGSPTCLSSGSAAAFEESQWTVLVAGATVQVVTSSEVWDEATAASYDDDVAAEFAPDVVGPAVEFLHSLAAGGPILEFAIGTGRVGLPLTERGMAVTGVELSEPMVDRLRRKVDEHTLPVVLGDMATTRVPGEFSLVVLVFNSISNLLTQEEQVECFRNAARHLRSGGRFVVELWVPPVHSLPPGRTEVAREVRDGFAALDTYDLASQACTSQTFSQRPDGSVRHDIGHFRYLWASECDLMARLAGLVLETRVADWHGGPFDHTSSKHISVWRKP